MTKKQRADQDSLTWQPKWWGYLHSNGSVQVKSWSGDTADYTTDCENNPFVLKVVAPLEAPTFEQASKQIKQLLAR